MTRKLIAAVGLMALVLPALADDAPYYDEQTGAWVNDGPPPDGGEQYAPPPAPNVDVSVDLATPGASVSFGTFQEPLAQYGQWVTVGTYGRVWHPTHVAAGWRPYYYGRWEWTDEGWLWASDEPWGWAAYHYGRWALDPYYGWVWIPGYQWAPAWVTWRYSPDYIGWAPLGPGFSVYVTSYPVNYGWWTFVPCRRFVGVPIHTVAYTGGYVRGIFRGTSPAPPRAAIYGAHSPAWGGPARPFVEQRVGRIITPVRLQPVGSPAAIRTAARPGIVPVYRPEARVAPHTAVAPAPGRALPQGSSGPAAAVRSAPPPATAPRPQGGIGAAPARPQQFSGPGAAPARPQGYAQPPSRPSQAMPERREPMSAPARPQPSYAPARPQPMNAPARPQGGAAPAPSHAPAQAPAHNRPQGSFAPSAPAMRSYAAAPMRAPARAPAVASAPRAAGRSAPYRR